MGNAWYLNDASDGEGSHGDGRMREVEKTYSDHYYWAVVVAAVEVA